MAGAKGEGLIIFGAIGAGQEGKWAMASKIVKEAVVVIGEVGGGNDGLG